MRVHLTTAVGGYVKVLPHMLRHYRALGVDSFFVHVNLFDDHDPILDQVRAVCDVTSVSVGGKLWRGNTDVHRAVMARHPDDWFILADQDELQIYPDGGVRPSRPHSPGVSPGDESEDDRAGRPIDAGGTPALHELFDECERRGYDSIEGTLIDRLAPGGVFAEIDPAREIWEQFPVSAIVTAALLGGEPRKIVAARGRVELTVGQHDTAGGRGCPLAECHVAVHHFKWTAGIVERLRERVRLLRERGMEFAEESERFLRYVEQHDEGIDLADPRFLAGAIDMATVRDVADTRRLDALLT
jgi:hypothetical protein